MKNRINFYQKALRPQRDLMPLQGVLVLWASAALIVITTWGYYAFQAQFQQKKIQQSQKKLIDAQTQLVAIKVKLAAKQNKDRLIKELKNIEQEIAHKQQVFGYLAAVNELSNTDYSQIMLDLARYHESSIWLTELIFAGQNITLKGQTLQSSQLPVWLSNLKHSPYFSGKKFSVLEFNEKNGVNEFNVSSELTVKREAP